MEFGDKYPEPCRVMQGKEVNMRKYEIDYTDPATGVTSPIDTQYAGEGYTAEQYIADCERNADEDWCEMLRNGTVEVVEIAD